MITANISEKGNAVAIRGLESLAPRTLDAAAQGLRNGLLGAVSTIQRDYLRGPRPQLLGVVTSRLVQSISSRVENINGRVVGVVGSNVRYAAFHEFGFSGTEQVRSFTRVISRITGIGHVVGGRAENGRLRASGGKKAAGRQKAGAVGFEYVKAHARMLNYAGRPFVAPGMAKSLPEITGAIEKAIAEVKP